MRCLQFRPFIHQTDKASLRYFYKCNTESQLDKFSPTQSQKLEMNRSFHRCK